MLNKFEQKSLLIALGIIAIFLAIMLTAFFLYQPVEGSKPTAYCKITYYNGTMNVFAEASGGDVGDLASVLFTKCAHTNVTVYK